VSVLVLVLEMEPVLEPVLVLARVLVPARHMPEAG